jgi:hypothetical protein
MALTQDSIVGDYAGSGISESPAIHDRGGGRGGWRAVGGLRAADDICTGSDFSSDVRSGRNGDFSHSRFGGGPAG